MGLFQLTYTSRAANFSQDQLAQILLTSRKNNADDKITGLLYTDEKYFLQCLEGQKSAVLERFKQIKKDPRHNNIHIIQQRSIDSRQFMNWNMAMVTQEQASRLEREHDATMPDLKSGDAKELCQFLTDITRIIN